MKPLPKHSKVVLPENCKPERRRKAGFPPNSDLSSLSSFPGSLGAYVGIKRFLPAQMSLALMQHISWMTGKKSLFPNSEFCVLIKTPFLLPPSPACHVPALKQTFVSLARKLLVNQRQIPSRLSAHLRVTQRSIQGCASHAHCSHLVNSIPSQSSWRQLGRPQRSFEFSFT